MTTSVTCSFFPRVKVGDVITVGFRPALVIGKPDETTLTIKYISLFRFRLWSIGVCIAKAFKVVFHWVREHLVVKK